MSRKRRVGWQVDLLSFGWFVEGWFDVLAVSDYSQTRSRSLLGVRYTCADDGWHWRLNFLWINIR